MCSYRELFAVVVFTLAVKNPSENKDIKQINSKSGLMQVTGRKSALTDSGNSVRPA